MSNIYQTKIPVIQKAYIQLSANVILETAKVASGVVSANLRVKTPMLSLHRDQFLIWHKTSILRFQIIHELDFVDQVSRSEIYKQKF